MVEFIRGPQNIFIIFWGMATPPKYIYYILGYGHSDTSAYSSKVKSGRIHSGSPKYIYYILGYGHSDTSAMEIIYQKLKILSIKKMLKSILNFCFRSYKIRNNSQGFIKFVFYIILTQNNIRI